MYRQCKAILEKCRQDIDKGTKIFQVYGKKDNIGKVLTIAKAINKFNVIFRKFATACFEYRNPSE